jgi:hypothetical protein
MKKNLLGLSLGIFLAASLQTQAQRYATEIFTSNEVESNVVFGANVNPFSIPGIQTDPDTWNAEMGALNANIDNGEPFPTE